MKKTFCDGCGVELDTKLKALQVEHTFPNGNTFRADVQRFGTDLHSPNKTILWNDGDLCSTCAETILQEGFVVS